MTQIVQEHSLESQSLDNSEQNSIQMNTGPNPEQGQHAINSNYSSHGIGLGRDAPTSFTRDMFPQHTSEQHNESESVRKFQEPRSVMVKSLIGNS